MCLIEVATLDNPNYSPNAHENGVSPSGYYYVPHDLDRTIRNIHNPLYNNGRATAVEDTDYSIPHQPNNNIYSEPTDPTEGVYLQPITQPYYSVPHPPQEPLYDIAASTIRVYEDVGANVNLQEGHYEFDPYLIKN